MPTDDQIISTMPAANADELDMLFADAAGQAPVGPAPTIIGRSELEAFLCPFRGAVKHQGIVSDVSHDADAGTECHRVIAAAVKARAVDGATPFRLRELMDDLATRAPAHVQPRVVETIRGMKYKIVEIITTLPDTGLARNPEDLWKYDGGEGDSSGQLTATLIPEADGNPRVDLTCGVDLIVPTVSPKELLVYDYKTGWREWTATEVKQSFQFARFYSWVIFSRFPAIDKIGFIIVMRGGECTSIVHIERKDMYAIGQQLLTLVGDYLRWKDAPIDTGATGIRWPHNPPQRPDARECCYCPALQKCPAGKRTAAEIATDPRALLGLIMVGQAQVDEATEMLKTIARESGGDIVCGELTFGQNKPTTRKPNAKPYAIYATPVGSESTPVVHAPNETVSPAAVVARGATGAASSPPPG